MRSSSGNSPSYYIHGSYSVHILTKNVFWISFSYYSYTILPSMTIEIAIFQYNTFTDSQRDFNFNKNSKTVRAEVVKFRNSFVWCWRLSPSMPSDLQIFRFILWINFVVACRLWNSIGYGRHIADEFTPIVLWRFVYILCRTLFYLLTYLSINKSN